MFEHNKKEEKVSNADMIRADKARLFPTSRRNKWGVMTTHIVERMNLAIVVPTHHKLNTPNSVATKTKN